MATTINELYLELFKRFRQEGTPSPSLEARELTAFVCHADKKRTAGWAHIYLDGGTIGEAHALADRYLGGEPLAYLLGEWDFYGLTFQVTPAALIPRSDTEALCELAIRRAQEVMEPRVLDLCCGSGCIGIALLHEVEDASVYAADLSEDALLLAVENARRLGVSAWFRPVRCNALVEPPSALGAFHMIVCNPPYISKEEFKMLDKSVVNYEPRMALYGGPDGLDFYRSITRYWLEALVPGGMLYFECGWQQAEPVVELCERAGLLDVCVHEDLSGIQRVVSARAPRAGR